MASPVFTGREGLLEPEDEHALARKTSPSEATKNTKRV
jgi:hypothetical protein